jgi:hypothetical protein
VPPHVVDSETASALELVCRQLDVLEGARRDGRVSLPGGDVLDVTNLAKVFWPVQGFTKGDLLRYYTRVSPLLLPAVADRPLVMKRYPNGISGKAFYQHRAPNDPPAACGSPSPMATMTGCANHQGSLLALRMAARRSHRIRGFDVNTPPSRTRPPWIRSDARRAVFAGTRRGAGDPRRAARPWLGRPPGRRDAIYLDGGGFLSEQRRPSAASCDDRSDAASDAGDRRAGVGARAGGVYRLPAEHRGKTWRRRMRRARTSLRGYRRRCGGRSSTVRTCTRRSSRSRRRRRGLRKWATCGGR